MSTMPIPLDSQGVYMLERILASSRSGHALVTFPPSRALRPAFKEFHGLHHAIKSPAPVSAATDTRAQLNPTRMAILTGALSGAVCALLICLVG